MKYCICHYAQQIMFLGTQKMYTCGFKVAIRAFIIAIIRQIIHQLVIVVFLIANI